MKSKFKPNTEFYGGYAIIKTDFVGSPHLYKIVNKIDTNSYCDIPICNSSEPRIHKKMEPVLNVIHCGIDETKVVRVATKDCDKIIPPTSISKSEAIKEFVERLTDKIFVYIKYVDVDGVVILNRIRRMMKDIEKEMTEAHK